MVVHAWLASQRSTPSQLKLPGAQAAQVLLVPSQKKPSPPQAFCWLGAQGWLVPPQACELSHGPLPSQLNSSA